MFDMARWLTGPSMEVMERIQILLHCCHWKPGTCHPLGRVGLRLLKPTFSPSYISSSVTRHTAILDEQWHTFFAQGLLYCIRSNGFLSECITN